MFAGFFRKQKRVQIMAKFSPAHADIEFIAPYYCGYAPILDRLLPLEISRQIIRVRVAPMLRSLLPLKLVVTTYVVLPIFFSVCLMVGIVVWVLVLVALVLFSIQSSFRF